MHRNLNFLLTAVLFLGSFALKAQTKSGTVNCVNIQPGTPLTEIVRQAANVTPSARQLRWQELELTAFFHFGVNTFTDREWGDGTEKEQIFNPTQLDAGQWVAAC